PEQKQRLENLVQRVRDFKVAINPRGDGGTLFGNWRVISARGIFQDEIGRMFCHGGYAPQDAGATKSGLLIHDPRGNHQAVPLAEIYLSLFHPSRVYAPILTPKGDAIWLMRSGTTRTENDVCRV